MTIMIYVILLSDWWLTICFDY